jgi:hypothetical protein
VGVSEFRGEEKPQKKTVSREGANDAKGCGEKTMAADKVLTAVPEE